MKCATPDCKGDPDAPGTALGLCARCYQRQRRDLPAESEPSRAAPGEGRRLTVRLSAGHLKRIARQARHKGITSAEWVRRACIRCLVGQENEP